MAATFAKSRGKYMATALHLLQFKLLQKNAYVVLKDTFLKKAALPVNWQNRYNVLGLFILLTQL